MCNTLCCDVIIKECIGCETRDYNIYLVFQSSKYLINAFVNLGEWRNNKDLQGF